MADVNTGFEAIDLNGVKGVLLDIDNTLYPYAPTHARAQAAVMELMEDYFEEFGKDELQAAYEASRRRIHTDLHGTGASHHRLLYFHRMIESLIGVCDLQLALAAYRMYWDTFLEGMSLHPDAHAFLERCEQNDVEICVVTDLVTEIQFEKLIKLGLDEVVDLVVTSEEAGVEKPHPYIFSLALEKMGLDASDVIMVGDSPDKDLKGADLLNIRAYHITLPEQG